MGSASPDFFRPANNKVEDCGTISANGAHCNTSISNGNVVKVLTKSECCVCLISVARKVTRTPPVNKSSTFQSFGPGHGRQVSQTTNTRWRQITRCVGHDIALLSRVRGNFKPPRSRTSQSARKNQTTGSRTARRVRKRLRHGLALLRVRGFSSFRSR